MGSLAGVEERFAAGLADVLAEVGPLGIRDTGCAVRAGLVPYNDDSDVSRLLAAVAELG